MGEYSEAFVAFDVAKSEHAVAIADGGRGSEVRFLGEVASSPAAVARLIGKLAGRYGKLLDPRLPEVHTWFLCPEHRHPDLRLALMALVRRHLALLAALQRPAPTVVDLRAPCRLPRGANDAILDRITRLAPRSSR